MNRRLYWLILLNPLFLILYGYGLSLVYQFCRYGSVSRRLPVIAGISLAGVLWVAVWTILYFILKRKITPCQRKAWQLMILIPELAAAMALTGFYGYRISLTAQPFGGKLGNYLYEITHKKELILTDRNFYEDGIDSILRALEKGCSLDPDSDLYTANTFVLSLDGEGMIQTVEAYLYARDADGTVSTYLISYNAARSEKMTVWLGGNSSDSNAPMECREQEQLSPLFDLVEALTASQLLSPADTEGFPDTANIGSSSNTSNTADASAASDPTGSSDTANAGTSYTIRYSGYTTGSPSGLWYRLTADGSLEKYSPLSGSTVMEGFLLKVYRQDALVMTLITGAGSMTTSEAEELQQKQEDEIAAAKADGSTLVREGDEMTFYLDESHSMSLIVADAAAGSRFYVFQNGDIYNEDPFDGRGGVAESIYFLDEATGFLLLANASADSSVMYYTTDGGVTFSRTELPLSEASEDMADNEFGYTVENMDYIETPYEEDGILYVRVSLDAADLDWLCLLFRSEDRGQTWEYSAAIQ